MAAFSHAQYGGSTPASTSDALVGLLTPIRHVSNQPTVRPGRWYDASPTLSLALKCLMLASSATRTEIVARLQRIVPALTPPAPTDELQGASATRATDDGLSHFWQVVNGLKHLPEGQRQHAAAFILSQLD